jgi:hypothetical protein
VKSHISQLDSGFSADIAGCLSNQPPHVEGIEKGNVLMSPQSISRTDMAKGLFLLFLFCLLSFFFVRNVQISSMAQSEERELEDKIPKHLPIKIKIKKEKEKAFKDLNNEKWARDFQLEVTNTGDRPIYFLDLSLVMPELTHDGYPIGTDLNYGRIELGTFQEKPKPEDAPLKPGETYVFTIPENNVSAWEYTIHEENRAQPRKIQIKFKILNFGDGTGFVGISGTPFPVPKKKSSLDRCVEQPNKSAPTEIEARLTESTSWPKTTLIASLPVSLLPANFLSTDSVSPISVTASPRDICCPGTTCWHAHVPKVTA